MKWKKYTIHTTTEAEDLVSMMLMELGAEGVQIEDNVPLSESDTKGMFIDILPELAADDGRSRLSFFLHLEEDVLDAKGLEAAADINKAAAPADGEYEKTMTAGGSKAVMAEDSSETAVNEAAEALLDPVGAEDNSYTIADRIWSETEIEKLLSDIRLELENMRSYIDIGEGLIEEGVTEDTDWRDNWKQFFKPIHTGDFLIKPTWEEIPEEFIPAAEKGELKVIEIDPGTAFGTGSHETTQLCLKELTEYIRGGETVLDVGTGSGILGIAALKCGAGFVAATELDEQCKPSIEDNLGFNGLDEKSFRLFIGNVIGDDKTVSEIRSALKNYKDTACLAVNRGSVSENNITASENSETAAGNSGIASEALETCGYDVVIANILAPVICMLAGENAVDGLIKKGGIFITSGIIDEKLDTVIAAFEENPAWEIIGVHEQGEWRQVTARRI